MRHISEAVPLLVRCLFFFNDTPTTEIYTLSLHDALPIACAHRWGQVVRPDRYGRWRQGDREVGFVLEYDCGTEPLDRLAAKLHGYDELVDATEISTLVLFWLPSSGREASVRQALAGEPRWGRMRYP